VELVDGELAAEVGLLAEAEGEVLERPYLLVLQGGELVDEEGVGEVVVDGGGEAEVLKGLAEEGVCGASVLEVEDRRCGLFGLAGTGEGVVRDDVGGAGDGYEGGGRAIGGAARAGREAGVCEGGKDVLEEVGAVGGGVEARVDSAGDAKNGVAGGLRGPGMRDWREV